jgi:hypothetical protein
VNIPDKEIDKIAEGLQVSKLEAMQIWLEDNEYEINEEQEKLDNSASKVKVSKDVAKKRTKSDKPRVAKVSDEKKALFDLIYQTIQAEYGENVEIVKENKLIKVKTGEKTLKIDLIEERPPKK